MSARPRRSLAGAVLLVTIALALAGARPASAAAPQGGITSPGENEIIFTVTPAITGEFSQPRNALNQAGSVVSVKLSLVRPEAAESDPPPPPEWTKDWPSGGERVEFDWTVPALAYNGAYTVTAQATGRDAGLNDQPETTTTTRTFRLAVPPAPPQGVKTSVNETTSEVAVTWQPNAEPDRVGYQVHRAAAGSSRWSEVATTATTSVVDTPPVGEWRYRVFAVRRGATATDLIPSDASSAVGAEVKTPPSTTAPSNDGESPATTTGGVTGGGTTGATASGGSTTPATVPTGRVDFSSFAQLLDQAQARSTPPPRPVEPDPGFQETLPFQPGEPADELGDDDSSDELGADEDANVVTRLITDESERRRSLSFVAGAFVAFVLMMLIRWLKKEAELLPLEPLDAMDADEAPRPVDAPPRRTLADRRAAAAIVVPAAEHAPRRPSARRASRRVSPRPANDRGQGPAPVRPRRRRSGAGDRRSPVG